MPDISLPNSASWLSAMAAIERKSVYVSCEENFWPTAMGMALETLRSSDHKAWLALKLIILIIPPNNIIPRYCRSGRAVYPVSDVLLLKSYRNELPYNKSFIPFSDTHASTIRGEMMLRRYNFVSNVNSLTTHTGTKFTLGWLSNNES